MAQQRRAPASDFLLHRRPHFHHRRRQRFPAAWSQEGCCCCCREDRSIHRGLTERNTAISVTSTELLKEANELIPLRSDSFINCGAQPLLKALVFTIEPLSYPWVADGGQQVTRFPPLSPARWTAARGKPGNWLFSSVAENPSALGGDTRHCARLGRSVQNRLFPAPHPLPARERCTMGQNQVILRHQKFTFP